MSIRHSATNEPPVRHNPAEAHGTLSFVFCHPVVISLSFSVMDVSLISRCCVCGSCLCLLPVWGLRPLSSNSSLPPFSVFEALPSPPRPSFSLRSLSWLRTCQGNCHKNITDGGIERGEQQQQRHKMSGACEPSVAKTDLRHLTTGTCFELWFSRASQQLFWALTQSTE